MCMRVMRRDHDRSGTALPCAAPIRRLARPRIVRQKPPRSLRDQNALARLIKGVPTDELVDAGVVKLDGADAIAGFIAAAKKTRIWDRAPKVRNAP
jgi:hypothetical protein